MFGRPPAEPLFCAAFIFEQHTRNEAFETLDAQIEKVARASDGFVGKEVWFADDKKRICANYYWRTMEHLQAFSKDPVHVVAKRRYKEWYSGFHIVISEVLRSYGDSAFEQITPNAREKKL